MTARPSFSIASSACLDTADFDSIELNSALLNDVLCGLSARQKNIPAHWLYDRRGSELFEAITQLPEYYPTRTERAILERNAADMAHLIGPGHAVVEFGSGSASKTPILLAATRPSVYVPIDISAEFLHASAKTMAGIFPGLPIYPVVGDFTEPLRLPRLDFSPRLGFFPGSTIGNLLAPAAAKLLRSIAATLGSGSMLLIGIDRIKSTDILLPAYNDAQGVTAEFNLNLLHRINRELEGDIPVEAFRHSAIWNPAGSRIEMHLEASRDVRFEVAGQPFQLRSGETIHTENSIKYGASDMQQLLNAGGWIPVKEWLDDSRIFSVVLARTAGLGMPQMQS